MMNAIGYDATHDNVASIPANAEVVMGYDTGSPFIKWTAADWSRFATPRKVHIDQGFGGTPVPTATVRDVETGAWTPEAAILEVRNWNAGRRTIYCNQSTLPRVLALGWRGDLWLAIPSNLAPVKPPQVPNCTVVAVQFGFDGTHDRSVVFDPYWPNRVPSMTGIQYPAPNRLRETATFQLSWDAVAPVNDKPNTGYTVSIMGMDGKEYYHAVTDMTSIIVAGLEIGWTFDVHVWANGGDVAPPHASLTIHT